MRNQRKTQCLLLVLLLLSSLLACRQEDSNINETSDQNKEVLIIGLDDTFAPMGFRDQSGELVGFDIDLAKEVSKRIQREIKFQPIDWSMKENELIAGNIDLIWNGYSITSARQEKVAFSQPYLKNSQIIVTLSESDIETKADLKGKNVCVQSESSALDAINQEPDIVNSFDNLVQFSTNNEAFNDLESGRSDALVVDEVLARYYMKQNGENKYRVLLENFGPEEFGIGMRKEDTELLKKINSALDEMRKDGSYDAIFKKWFSDN